MSREGKYFQQRPERQLRQRSNSIQDQIGSLKNRCDNLQKNNQQTNKTIQDLQDQNSRILKQNAQANGRIQSLSQRERRIQIERKGVEAQLTNINRYLITLKANIKQQKDKINNKLLAAQQASKDASQIKQLQRIIPLKENQLANLLKQIQSLRNQIAALESERDKRVLSQGQIERSINQNNEQLKTSQRQVEKLKSIIAKIKENIIINERQLSAGQNKILQNDAQIKTLNARLNRQRQQLRLTKQVMDVKAASTNSKPISTMFVGEVLDDQDSYKELIVDVVQKRLGSTKIVGTRLIYRYDPLNLVNFHKYIDNNTQLVIVIRLANGFVLGAWIEGSFFPKMKSENDGVIFSFTNHKAFDLQQPNHRAISYDDFFLIIGNSEIRLKTQDNKIFSNFGINNGYYNSRNQKVDVLLGSGLTREVELQTFEVFQLKLK